MLVAHLGVAERPAPTPQRKESLPARWHSSSESSNVQLKPRHFQVGITQCLVPPLSPQRAQSGQMSDFRR